MSKRAVFGSLFLLLLAGAPSATTIYVPDDFSTIQAAIDGAANSDVIIVRAGTYVENLDFLGKAITVESEAGPDSTVIDGNSAQSVVTFQSAEGADSVLDGFTILNGTGTDYNNKRCGGGIICINGSSPTIRRNLIESNTVEHKGGGIYCNGSSPSILENVIRGNSVTDTDSFTEGGGGIHCSSSSAVIWKNSISQNMAYGRGYHQCWGGGLFFHDSSVTLAENVIEKNTSDYAGGGITIYAAPSAGATRVTGNVISENSAIWGGGVSCGFASPLFANNWFRNNAAETGAAIDFYDSLSEIYNCFFFENTASLDGGGVAFQKSSLSIGNCTFTRNVALDRGGAIFCGFDSAPTVVNSILWGDLAFYGAEIYLDRAPAVSFTISYSDVTGGLTGVHVSQGTTLDWGQGMIDADPLFAKIHEPDLHLLHDSPCRNKGDSTVVPPGLAGDSEGDPRISGTRVDMGADEFHPRLYLAGPVLSGPNSPMEVRLIGEPMTPYKLAIGSGVLDPPLPTPHGDFCLVPPLFPVLSNNLPHDGFLCYYTNVPLSWQPGDRIPCQALVGKWGEMDTRFTNLLLVVVE